MEHEVSLDIIIPSFRYSAIFLDSIVSLSPPKGLRVTVTIVIDNPQIVLDRISDSLNRDVKIIVNRENLGAAESRNIGIEATSNDWILFLDDDIIPSIDLLQVYGDFILNPDNDYMGAIGLTQFPQSSHAFTKAVRFSDIITFFEIANWQNTLKWGVTANILVKREILGSFRFSRRFPKNGGGEDIELFLRCFERSGKDFTCLPHAKVYHPWWPGGRKNYRRFFRWAYGDSLLPTLNPKFKYYNWPNALELWVLMILSMLFFFAFNPLHLLITTFSVMLGEWIGEGIKQVTLKKNYNPLLWLEVSLIRASNDLGRIIGNFSRFNYIFLGERFDYFCDGKHIKHERKWALVKLLWILSLVLFGLWVAK